MLKILVISVLYVLYCYPQHEKIIYENDLVGVWQEQDSIVAAGLKDSYRFFQDKNFIFETSRFNYVSRLNKIQGKYRLKENILFLKIEKITENLGGILCFGDNNYWEFENESTKTYQNNDCGEIDFDISIILGKNKEIKMIKINNINFYKISSNPNEFRDD